MAKLLNHLIAATCANELEVTFANQSIKRLIGEAALPAVQRLTRTASNAYQATDPLQPSGFFGPVKIGFVDQ